MKKSAYALQFIWAHLKTRYLAYTLQLMLGGPLESKVAYLYVAVADGTHWKQGTLHITVDIEGHFKGRVLNDDVVKSTLKVL